MDILVSKILLFHAAVGGAALISGLLALGSRKGRKWHRTSGRVYFWTMTLVFITGLLVAGYRFNRFLFLIAFLSYYSVFAGTRILKLKNLHLGQRPKWYDWGAGLINALANLFFIGLGIYYLALGRNLGAPLLSIGFGIGGMLISYTNLIPFVKKPQKPYHWYMSHIGNMTGGYIATSTAFISTMNTRLDLLNPFWAFALPSLIGIPVLLFWQRQVENKYKLNNTSDI